jgi:hypothetical protein
MLRSGAAGLSSFVYVAYREDDIETFGLIGL